MGGLYHIEFHIMIYKMLLLHNRTSHVSTRTIGTMSILSSSLNFLDLVVGTLLAVQVDPKNLSTSHTTYIKQRKKWGDFQVKIGGTY